MDAAELIISSGSGGGSSAVTATGPGQSGSQGAGGGPLPEGTAAQAAAVIKSAVDEGFMAALTISRTNADALVSCAAD
jgi:hypothetical protein